MGILSTLFGCGQNNLQKQNGVFPQETVVKKYSTKYFGEIPIYERNMNSGTIPLIVDYKGEKIRITLLSVQNFNQNKEVLDVFFGLIDSYFEIDKIAKTSIRNKYSINDIFGFLKISENEDVMNRLGYPPMAIAFCEGIYYGKEEDEIEVSVFYHTKGGRFGGQQLTVRMDEKLNVTECSLKEDEGVD